ncbi:MAG: hypothetical protein AAF226_18625 [Verrucomicrobiota bacterium]
MSESEKQAGSGIVKGCSIGCLVVFLIGVIIAVVLGVAAKRSLNGLVEDFTTTERIELVEPDISGVDRDDAITKVDQFIEKLNAKEPTGDLILTSDEINAIILHHPDFQAFSDKVKVDIRDGVIDTDFSVPLDSLGFVIPLIGSALKGRYISGSGEIDVHTVDGKVSLFVIPRELNGNSTLGSFTEELQKRDLMDSIRGTDPEIDNFLNSIQIIKVEGDRVIISIDQSHNQDPSENTDVL